MKRTTKELADRRDALEAELSKVRQEIAARAGETEDKTNPPPDPQPDPEVDPETGKAVEDVEPVRTATAKTPTKTTTK